MRLKITTAAVAVFVTGVAAQDALAKRIAIRVVPPAVRAVTADVVVVGKVASLEADPVEAFPQAGAEEKVAYKIALVKVESALSGAKGLTHVKVGFPAAADNGGGRGPRGGFGPITLADGQEGCFFLAKHPVADFYVINMGWNPLDAKADGHKADLATAKTALAVVADPAKALKADKADDRFTAAAVLVSKYRTPPEGVEVVEEKIPAAETKAIFAALLAREDWSAADPVTGQTATTLFGQLGVGPGQGFKPKPNTGTDYNAYIKTAVKEWVPTMPESYSIVRLVRKK